MNAMHIFIFLCSSKRKRDASANHYEHSGIMTAERLIVSFVSSVFEQYQKARTTFVQTVAELASRPQNIETLQNAGKALHHIFASIIIK